MTDFQAYIASVTLVALAGMYVVQRVAIYAIGKYRAKDQ